MHVPEQLFSLPLLKDVRTQPLEIIQRTVTVTSAGLLNSSLLYTVPKDRIFCLSGWGVGYAVVGGGGGMVSAWVALGIQGTVTHYLQGQSLGYNPTGALASFQHLGASASIWVPPGSEVYLAQSNNSIDAPNIFYTLNGLTFPRGSVSIG